MGCPSNSVCVDFSLGSRQHITVSFRSAPISVVMSTMLANSGVNTGLDIQIEEGVDVMVSGDYTGTFEEVLERVSNSFSLNVELDQSKVRISDHLSEVSLHKIAATQPTPTASETATATPKSTPINTAEPQTKTRQLKHDKFVEQLFHLKNVSVADSTLNDSQRTVIPGAVSQLKQLIQNLGVQEFQYQGAAAQPEANESVSIVAMASINAVKVRDRSSKMALYRDLIESIDASLVSASPGPSWTVVK